MITFSAALAIVLIMFIVGVNYEWEGGLSGLVLIAIAVSVMYGVMLIWL